MQLIFLFMIKLNSGVSKLFGRESEAPHQIVNHSVWLLTVVFITGHPLTKTPPGVHRYRSDPFWPLTPGQPYLGAPFDVDGFSSSDDRSSRAGVKNDGRLNGDDKFFNWPFEPSSTQQQDILASMVAFFYFCLLWMLVTIWIFCCNWVALFSLPNHVKLLNI